MHQIRVKGKPNPKIKGGMIDTAIIPAESSDEEDLERRRDVEVVVELEDVVEVILGKD